MADEVFGVAYLTCKAAFNDIHIVSGPNGFTFDFDVLCAFNGADATSIPCTFSVDRSVLPVLAKDYIYEICAAVRIVCVEHNVVLTFMKVCASNATFSDEEFALVGEVFRVRDA